MKRSMLKKVVSSILAASVISGYGIVSLADDEELTDIDVPEETEETVIEEGTDEPVITEETFFEDDEEETEASVEEEIIPEEAEVSDYEAEEVLAAGIKITDQFPDANLAECIGEGCDKNADGYLSADEISQITTLDARNRGISKLDGIECLTSLQVLNVSSSFGSDLPMNTIEDIDISGLPSLVELDCNHVNVWHITFGDNTNLKKIDAGNNSTLFTSLDFSSCPNLEDIDLDVTAVTSVNISKNHKLKMISVSDTNIGELDISGCPYLIRAYQGSNFEGTVYPGNGYFSDMIIYAPILTTDYGEYCSIKCNLNTIITMPKWKHNSKGWWFEATDGYYYKSCWMELDGKWYYFGKDGYAAKGWQKVGKKYYYFGSDNAMQTDKWIKSGSKWCYIDGNGVMATGWKQIKSKWYYFDANGYMKTGWLKSGKDWYYMNSDGSMATFKWVKSGGKWYYFDIDGKMVHSTNYGIKGKTYKFDANGVCLNP